LNAILTQADKHVILDGLSSSDGEVRRLSVEQLPQLEIEEAVPYLAERLGDEVWRVRKAAVECLVRCIEHPPVQETLVASLADGDDPGRRNSAFEALVACGSRVTPRLITELSNPDVDVRKLVVDALAAIADPGTREPLVHAITDTDTNVRAAAAEALGMVGGVEEVEKLLGVVNAPEEDVLVRLSALRALARLEADTSVAALGTALDESALRSAALTLLGMSDDPAAVEVLLKALAGRVGSGREAAMAALLEKLGRLDGEAEIDLRGRLREAARASEELVASACDRLEASNLPMQLVLIQFLGLLDEPRVVIPILKAGRDEAIEELSEATLESLGEIVPNAIDAVWDDLDSELKRRACVVLGRLGGDAAETRLVEGLVEDDSELRCAAARALGHGPFAQRIPDLAQRLEAVARDPQFDSHEEIATLISAVVGLAKRPEAVEASLDVQTIEILSRRLDGASETLRLAIAQVLARLGPPSHSGVIVYLLKDESPAVRRAAVQALVHFEFSDSRESLKLACGDESEGVRTAAANVLGQVDDIAAIADLERMTLDDSSRVVAVALRALGSLCRRLAPASDMAYSMLEAGIGRSPMVALASIEALADVGGEHASTLALEAIGRAEPEVVRAVIDCVDMHGTEADLASLLSLVPHQDWSVRAEAARVLSRRRYRKALPPLLRRLELEDDAFVRESVLSAIRRLEE
jgi:HEAT repeat protein